ncbi:MAG: VgrG-related protein [Synechococcales bacterium]|nr:VgrG-related protein [Synechococcales bacterium]
MPPSSTVNGPVGSYQSLPDIEIDGDRNPPKVMDDLLQVIVEESLHLPAMFTLVLRNDYQPVTPNEKVWKHQNLLKMGKTVKIGLVPGTSSDESSGQSSGDRSNSNRTEETYLIEGEITAIETHFSDRTQAPIIIRGYDVSHRLQRGRFNRSFQNMTDTDIVKKVIDEVGIKAGEIDESGIPHDYVFQENQTNMAFLRDRAARLGYELFVQDGALNFRAPKSSDTLKLKWLKDISNFRVRVTSAEQVKEVEVRGWDYSSKRPFVSTVQSEHLITETDNGQGKDSSSAFDKKPDNPKMLLVDRPVFQSKEADVMAQALYDELSGQYVHADAKGEGNPEIRPGRVVELEDMGPHSGKYYVTETRHSFTERVYTTEFSVRGLRCGDLLSTLSPKTRPQPGQTLLVGIVTDNEDPEGWGRVKVKFPTLTEDHNSHWARVVSIGAGSERGFDCLPEIDDEVLVGFEHGDIHRPYIFGGVWNGEDTPPNKVDDNVQGSKVRLRTFQTRVGHKIQFIEDGGVLVETNGGHKIYLEDSSNSISIKSTGDLKIDAKNIDITASATMNLKGAMININ